MSNDFYTSYNSPRATDLTHAEWMRTEFRSMQRGFDKFPSLVGKAGKLVDVDGGGSLCSHKRYSVGTWTPVLTCENPGNLNVAYTTQVGQYVQIGRLVHVQFTVVTSTFTYSTATGYFFIDLDVSMPWVSATLADTGFTLARTNWAKAGANQTLVTFRWWNHLGLNCANSGSLYSAILITDIPSGTALTLAGSLQYYSDYSSYRQND